MKRHRLDNKVPAGWTPPPRLADRKDRMLFSDRLWHWLVSLGGLAIVAAGAGIMALPRWLPLEPETHMIGKFGGIAIGLGIAIFALGFPSEAQRKGYRE